ncbi:MAG: hypothetical protein AAB562_02945 [Patescibacteria group bacterium]
MSRVKLSHARQALQNIAEVCGFIMYRGPHQTRFTLGGLDDYQQWKCYENWREEQKRIRYLRKQKLIEARKVGGRLMVRLTEKGGRQALRDRLLAVNKPCPDGLCFVVFDIPESERGSRNLFRRLLRECEFTMLQQSVWFSDKDISVPLLDFVRHNKLTPWIHIIIGDVLSAPKLKRSLLGRPSQK